MSQLADAKALEDEGRCPLCGEPDCSEARLQRRADEEHAARVAPEDPPPLVE